MSKLLLSGLITGLIVLSHTAQASMPVQETLNLRDHYPLQTPIEIKVTNSTLSPITFNEAGQCHRFFKVYDRNNNQLNISDPQALCTMEFRSVVVNQQETKIVDTWNQKIHTSCPPNANCFAPPELQVAPGAYTIEVFPDNADPIRKTVIIDDSPTFSDVTTAHWAYNYISDLVQRSIVHGYGNGKFGPENSITRAEVVKIAINAALNKGLHRDEIPSCFPGNCASPEIPLLTFTDVPPSHAMYPYIEVAADLEIIASGNYFYPNRPATRFECLEILLNAFEKQTEIAAYMSSPTTSNNFSDTMAANMAPYAGFAREEGIVSGVNGRFYPNESVKRAEIAKIASNLLSN